MSAQLMSSSQWLLTDKDMLDSVLREQGSDFRILIGERVLIPWPLWEVC